jgi:hypothetical protein
MAHMWDHDEERASSRPKALPETAAARAGCQEPLRREPVRGPQRYVKPAASTESQPESRAAHVTAKATSSAPQSGGVRAGGLGGVRGAARGQGEERNTRGPSAQPQSGQRGSCVGWPCLRSRPFTIVSRRDHTRSYFPTKCSDSSPPGLARPRPGEILEI